MKITKSEREAVKLKFGGRCAYCGCELNGKWHVDHVKAIYRNACLESGAWKPENHNADNWFPACVPCNLFKSVFDIEGLRREIADQVARARRYSVNFRTAERFGLVQVVDIPIKFWFEKWGG